jgi:insulin receptor
LGCPPGYMEKKIDNSNETTCDYCGKECQKRCQSKIIDSIAAAQSLKGCNVIDGPLEIQIRSSSKSYEQTSNIVKELENSLSDIVEIQDYLKIARSFPIVSLSFLKNLKTIRGLRLESNKYSMVVWDNQNLQELWDETQKINISNGKLFFHYNPKLCFFKIERLVPNAQILIENFEFAQKSNGDKTPCNVTKLEVNVPEILAQGALLEWKPLKLDDERSLLSYVVFYIPSPFKNITLWASRDACGNDGWLVDDVNDFNSKDPNIAYPLTKLEPYTQYAYYVKAYTLATEKTGAQSDINYFRTLPGVPQAITKLKAVSKSSSTIVSLIFFDKKF